MVKGKKAITRAQIEEVIAARAVIKERDYKIVWKTDSKAIN
ncbi:MAG: hypothetical protein AB8H79_26800 [Myxococcota bacterium]